jgi:hypothetical protein
MRVSSTVSCELSGVGAEARRRDGDQQGRAGHAQRADADQDQEQHAADAIDQGLGLGFAARLRYSARMGTKACENAPSANSRRSRLGRRKATKKGVGHHAGAEGSGR